MRQLYIFFILLFALSCSKTNISTGNGDVDRANDKIEISEENLKYDLEKDKKFINIPVKTNLSKDKWQVSSDKDWCVVSQATSGSIIQIYVKANEEVDVRSAIITAKCAKNSYQITIRQIGYGPAILVKENNKSIGDKGGKITITVTSNIKYKIEKSKNTDWIVDVTKTKAFVDYNHSYTIEENKNYTNRTAIFTYTGIDYPKTTAQCTVKQDAKIANVSQVHIPKDIKIKPKGGKASEAQPNSEIEKSFDGKISNNDKEMYHSTWNKSANFPVILEYYFNGTEEIDYILYHSRNGNGNFGKFKLYATTAEKSEYLVGEYNFNKAGGSSKIKFKEPLKKVKTIKFSVESGAGDYVSCAEMEFYKLAGDNNALNEKLLTVFKDITCCELKENITDEQIESLPGFFAQLAFFIKNGNYTENEKMFRMAWYHPYSDPEIYAEKLMTKRYSKLDNPTGIYAEQGDSIIVLVGETNGKPISLISIDGTEAHGTTYSIEKGVNKVGISKTGMLYIKYSNTPTEAPIRVHIPMGCGRLNGYFDLKRDKTDEKYAELLKNSFYKYFVIKGNNIMFCFHRSKLMEFVPNKILSAINLWDNMVGWQHELMGLDKLRETEFNSHVYAISPESSYMWASDYNIGFVYTYLDNILLKEKVLAAKDNAWGPAHEIGHIHQKAINWPSSTESSNNLFSNYTLYKLGKYCSRGSELKYLADCRFGEKQAWYNMGDATHQNESTEIHLRMNWQLWTYYHRCGYKPDFWPTLFGLLREEGNRIVESNPGEGQLKFAKLASKAANENLTDFFKMWGFLEPVPRTTYSQYGTWNYEVTNEMIKEAKDYMAQFPDPKHAFYYIEDRKKGDVGLDTTPPDCGYFTAFKDNTKITKEIKYTLSNRAVRVFNGYEAVAFEIRRNNAIVYFSNMSSFEVPANISLTGATFYAVQADGKLIEMKKQ